MTYRVKVVQSSGGPKLWHWEIHKDGNPIFAQRSLQGFATPEEASQAGEATQRLEDPEAIRRLVELGLKAKKHRIEKWIGLAPGACVGVDTAIAVSDLAPCGSVAKRAHYHMASHLRANK
jgi:hypothetical protein